MDFLNNNFISEFFLIALRWFYSFLSDYSIAIVLLTILMRAVLLPLDLKQRKNSRKMTQIQPELESIKKRYANNPQLFQKKQKELYAKEGVKPLAGCLPLLLQLPIFFAFFGAMRVLASEQTVNLILNAVNDGVTQLPSWLWVHNFWQPDSGLEPILPLGQNFITFLQSNGTFISPQTLSILQQKNIVTFANGNFTYVAQTYDALTNNILSANGLAGLNNGWFILPVLAGASLFFQQRLMTNSGVQQDQGKMMMWLFPLFSVWICATSNTAFAVYWLASNVYALGQQSTLAYIEKRKYLKKRPQALKEA